MIFTLAAGIFSPESVAFAYQESYRGTEKVTEYSALSTFTEDGIKYYVTKYASGSKNGEVYVAGCTFSLETINIPAVVKHGSKYDVVGINDMAFQNYENLTKVTIEDGLSYIGSGAFWGCWYLESINLPKTLTELGDSAFEYCGSLKSISFPDSLTVIPGYVCAYSSVSKVTFGKKVSEIKSGAFRECNNIKEITLPASLKTIGDDAFGYCRNLGKVTNQSKLKDADYKKAFNTTKWDKPERATAIYYTYSDKDMPIKVYLDNKQLTKGYLYYRMNSYNADSQGFEYDDWEHGVYEQLKKDSDGIYILDKKFITDGMFPVDGEFYYCETKPKDFLKDYTLIFKTSDIPSASVLSQELYDADTAEAERIKAEQGEEAYKEFISKRKGSWEYFNELEDAPRPVRLYTVHYEQGEYECRFMPEDVIISRYGYNKLGGDIDLFLSGYGRVQNPVAAARALAYYADENGRRIGSVKDITAPVTVHPVFVNEDELFVRENYLAENDWYYSSYMHCDEDWSKIAENVKIKKGTELVTRLLTEPNQKDGLCIIDGNVTVSCSELEKVYSAMADDAREKTYIQPDNGYFYNCEEFIVVKSGGTLVIDGVQLHNGIRVSLQKGAALKLINGAMIDGGVLAVQKGASVELYDGTFDGAIMNEGKIVVKTPNFKRATDSFYKKSLRSNMFLNCKTGVIDLDYGKLGLGNDFDMNFGPGTVRSDLRDEKDAVVINNGTINVTGYGYISMADSYQNREHKESYSKTPIVNYGTINITSSADRYYEFAAFKIDHNSFYNYGTIKVSSDVKRSNRYADSYAGRVATYELSADSDMEILESEFINYGTLDLNIKNGVGMAVLGNFFPRDRVIRRFEEDGDAASHGRLENRAGGKVNITTDNGCGIVLGRDAYLINDGTVTIKDKDENSKEPSLLVAGRVVNDSKITNDGSIGYSTAGMYKAQKSYALDNGYTGKKWTGKGRELLGYLLDLRGPDYYEDYNLYVSSGKSVLCDGSTYLGESYAETVYLPADTKAKLNVKVSGFADKTVEFTTAKSVKDYVDTAYKNIKAGADPNSYIKISLTKGKGTADSSVTKYPMDLGDQIIIGDMYYSVTTADLKGGTVCFEHGSGMHTSLDIPDTIKYEGRTYKVTMFDYAGTEVTKVTIGKNVEYLTDTAFKFSSKVKTINIKTKLLKEGSIAKGAFDEVPESCVITVPKKKLKAYKKLFQAAGLNKKVKIKGK